MNDFESALNQLLSDPGQMEKIVGAAKAFMQSSNDEPNAMHSNDSEAPQDRQAQVESILSGIDPKLIGIFGKLIGEYSSGSDKEALLHAMRPYLRSERRSQFERAAEMAKLARVARVAMGEFGGMG